MGNTRVQKHVTSQSPTCYSAVKSVKNTRPCAIILILIMITTVLGLYPGTASLIGDVTVRSSGVIEAISPLHVEGPYVKNSVGNTVNLSGICKVEWADQSGGTWMGNIISDYSRWNPSWVVTELDAMKSWGINVIRCHQAIEQWKYDMGQHKQMFKEFIALAAARGMYVIYDGYSVRNYNNGATQDPLPYPPYQTTPGASAIITSADDYIDYMVSVANELKSCPNIIFELWNEPHGDDTAKASWFDVGQRCINAIRAAGVAQLIIFQWNYNCWVNLDYPSGADTMDWVWQANLTDPTGNLVYSTHIYRTYGAFHHSVPTYSLAWTEADIQQAFQYFRFPEVVAQYPLIIGEIGADIGLTGDELTHELSALDTCLTLFEQMGIHYTPFWWRNIGPFRLHGGPPNFDANVAGQILYSHMVG